MPEETQIERFNRIVQRPKQKSDYPDSIKKLIDLGIYIPKEDFRNIQEDRDIIKPKEAFSFPFPTRGLEGIPRFEQFKKDISQLKERGRVAPFGIIESKEDIEQLRKEFPLKEKTEKFLQEAESRVRERAAQRGDEVPEGTLDFVKRAFQRGAEIVQPWTSAEEVRNLVGMGVGIGALPSIGKRIALGTIAALTAPEVIKGGVHFGKGVIEGSPSEAGAGFAEMAVPASIAIPTGRHALKGSVKGILGFIESLKEARELKSKESRAKFIESETEEARKKIMEQPGEAKRLSPEDIKRIAELSEVSSEYRPPISERYFDPELGIWRTKESYIPEIGKRSKEPFSERILVKERREPIPGRPTAIPKKIIETEKSIEPYPERFGAKLEAIEKKIPETPLEITKRQTSPFEEDLGERISGIIQREKLNKEVESEILKATPEKMPELEKRAYHISRSEKELETLDPRFEGTGISAEEAKRREYANYIPRTSLYLPGTKPETLVESIGKTKYGVSLSENLYDFDIDPLGFRQKASDYVDQWKEGKITAKGWLNKTNEAERMIRDAGYSGFIAQGQARSFDIVKPFVNVEGVIGISDNTSKMSFAKARKKYGAKEHTDYQSEINSFLKENFPDVVIDGVDLTLGGYKGEKFYTFEPSLNVKIKGSVPAIRAMTAASIEMKAQDGGLIIRGLEPNEAPNGVYITFKIKPELKESQIARSIEKNGIGGFTNKIESGEISLFFNDLDYSKNKKNLSSFLDEISVKGSEQYKFSFGEFLTKGESARSAIYEYFGKGREEYANRLWDDVQRRKEAHLRGRFEGIREIQRGNIFPPPTQRSDYYPRLEATTGQIVSEGISTAPEIPFRKSTVPFAIPTESPLSPTFKEPAKPVTYELGEAKSRVYERLKQEHPDVLTENVTYTEINLKEDAAKGVDLANKDVQKAYRVAMGVESVPDQTSTGVNIALSEKALDEGNYNLYTQLVKKRSLDQTRRGQEIVAEKGSVTDNSTSRYVKELIAARMEKIGKRLLPETTEMITGKTKAISSRQRANKIVSEQATKAQKKLGRGLDIKEAQALLDRITCK